MNHPKPYLAPLALFAALALVPWAGHTTRAQATDAANPKVNASPSSLSGPLKIVKLLWDSNPTSAAATLTRSISTAVARGELAPLRAAIEPLRDPSQAVLAIADCSDPRYAPALAVALLGGSLQDPTPVIERALQEVEGIEPRQMLWQLWLLSDAPATQDYFLKQLTGTSAEGTSVAGTSLEDASAAGTDAGQDERWMNILISSALSSHRSWTSHALIEHWQQLSPTATLLAIEPLTSSADSMELLLDGIEQGNISKDLINTNQLRKWLNSDNAKLTARIESIWGAVRGEDDVVRQQLVVQTLEQLSAGARGSASRGALVFTRVCSQCHVLHDRGFEVGPNIAQNGRGNLQQLVSNILDPSLVIGEAFQAKTVLTVDGQVVSGLVAAENDRYLSLKVQGGKIVEFDKDDIEQVKTSSKSLMPEGIESQLQTQELLDLLAYLCLLNPLESPQNELVPGTPRDFVQP